VLAEEEEAEDDERPSELDVTDAPASAEFIEPVDARLLSRRESRSPDAADLARELERENGAATVWSSRVLRERLLPSRLPDPVASAVPPRP